jgi:hypothetical protein
MSHIVHSDHIAITSGDKSTTGSKVSLDSRHDFPAVPLSRCVILATRTVATGGFGKVIRASHRLLSSIAATSFAPLSTWPISSRSALSGAYVKRSDEAVLGLPWYRFPPSSR